MSRNNEPKSHAARLAELFAKRLNNNMYTSALVSFDVTAEPPSKTFNRAGEVAEIQALLDRYNEKYPRHTAVQAQ